MAFFIGCFCGASSLALLIIALGLVADWARPEPTPEEQLAQQSREAEARIASISRAARSLMQADLEARRLAPKSAAKPARPYVAGRGERDVL
jgi:hypothetical protein